ARGSEAPPLLPPPPEAPAGDLVPMTRGPRVVTGAGEVLGGALNGKVEVRDGAPRWEDPLARRGWQAEEAWRLPVLGPLAVFGQGGGSRDEPGAKDPTGKGRTRVARPGPLFGGAGVSVCRRPGLA